MTASICRSGIRSTLPVEAIRDSASARCPSSQCEPGEMAAMPSSTSAGVLGMTRTTATPSGTRDSMKAVVMPAARLTSSWPGRSSPAISSRTAAMSCGLTTSATVSALRAASALETTATPYCSSSSRARSGRFSPTSRLSTRRPARTSPESRVSPITPAPMIAVCGHRRSYFLEISERRKKVRFCGRSAIRRMR